ncbi:unnamed protein product [Thlaspi arvense]|uniref:Uncharacterized protein n=1 Tax=Thlaspi arvense TaxID=13288 RepID=A0AAU9SPF0_THLAR|nr:unnamed protein product [Thlaspi arvense]
MIVPEITLAQHAKANNAQKKKATTKQQNKKLPTKLITPAVKSCCEIRCERFDLTHPTVQIIPSSST